MTDFQAQDSSAAAGMETRAQIAGGHPIIRHNNTDQCQTSANIVRRVVPAPIKRVVNEIGINAATPVPAKVALPVTRRTIAAPVRIVTGEPVTAATQPPLKTVPVDSIERFADMLEASISGDKPEKLVLFGAGVYDGNGKPRNPNVAFPVTKKSKTARARRVAPMRKDGFTTKCSLKALGMLLPGEESADSV